MIQRVEERQPEGRREGVRNVWAGRSQPELQKTILRPNISSEVLALFWEQLSVKFQKVQKVCFFLSYFLYLVVFPWKKVQKIVLFIEHF